MPKPPPPSPTRLLLKTYKPQPRFTPRYFPSSHRALDMQETHTPPYPYPRQRWYKQANFGLYGGLARHSGGSVADGKNKTRSLRVFRPNLQRKRLWSQALGRWVRVKVVTRVLRTIDKVGGLDAYLLGEKPARVKELGMAGWALRWRVMRTPVVRERMARERERLGLEGEAPWQIRDLEKAFKRLLGERRMGKGQANDGELTAREAQIDGLLEEDDRRAERGEDRGLLLQDADSSDEGPRLRNA